MKNIIFAAGCVVPSLVVSGEQELTLSENKYQKFLLQDDRYARQAEPVAKQKAKLDARGEPLCPGYAGTPAHVCKIPPPHPDFSCGNTPPFHASVHLPKEEFRFVRAENLAGFDSRGAQ